MKRGKRGGGWEGVGAMGWEGGKGGGVTPWLSETKGTYGFGLPWV